MLTQDLPTVYTTIDSYMHNTGTNLLEWDSKLNLQIQACKPEVYKGHQTSDQSQH